MAVIWFLPRMKKYDILFVFCNLSEDVVRQYEDCNLACAQVFSAIYLALGVGLCVIFCNFAKDKT